MTDPTQTELTVSTPLAPLGAIGRQRVIDDAARHGMTVTELLEGLTAIRDAAIGRYSDDPAEHSSSTEA